jgi:CRP/FNR family transcriptional regulator
MITHQEIEMGLGYFGKELTGKILEASVITDIAAGTEILREGQYIRSIPIVLRGLVKVCTRSENKELLLYYIRPFQSCVMSFSTGLKLGKSKAFAIAEEDSTILLIPADKVSKWITEYQKFNELFYNQFELRYLDLLETINQLLFDKLDKRLYDYLKEKVQLTGKNPVAITHREIAGDLGSAREVISRIMKKLEKENKVQQLKDSIRVL